MLSNLRSGKLPTKRACINNKFHKCSRGILFRPCNMTAIRINNEIGGVLVKKPAQMHKQPSQTTLITIGLLIIGNKPIRLMTQHVNAVQNETQPSKTLTIQSA